MRYAFCPKCGSRLSFNVDAERNRPYCPACAFIFYQNPTVAVAGILIRNGKVLLGRRRQGSFMGQWCFPGGYVEWNEDVYDAVKREFAEETGLRIQVAAVYTVLSDYGGEYTDIRKAHNLERQNVIIWFLFNEMDGELSAGDDIEEVQFFGSHEWPMMAFPTHEAVLRKLKDENLII